jgi:hypothetical protein
MEPLWSPAVAIGGNRWQMGRPATSLRQAKTVAVGCDGLPELFHGKEGVDGSSPSEGSAKVQQTDTLLLGLVCRRSNVRWVWSRLWSFQFDESLIQKGLIWSPRRGQIDFTVPLFAEFLRENHPLASFDET